MKKIILTAAFIFGMAAMIFAQNTNLEDVLSPEYAEYLKAKELKENRSLIDSLVDEYDEALKELAK